MQRNYKSFQSFLDVNFHDDDEDDDQDDDKNVGLLDSIDEHHEAPPSMDDGDEAPSMDADVKERKEKQKKAKDLLQLASKIEVFSYLSPEAVRDILQFAEYVDFDNVGDVVFDGDTLDGSMYCVVSGEVVTTLMIENNNHFNNTGSPTMHRNASSNLNRDFSFIASPGEVITSLLTIITSLIREYTNSQEPALNVATLKERSKIVIIPDGMNVRAIVSSPNTRLMKVPAKCFVTILEKFPDDVHRICQTIVARLQRVTIQTLVRFLGLGEEVLGLGDASPDNNESPREKVPPLKTDEFTRFEKFLSNELNDVSVQSVTDQATLAVASLLGLSGEQSKILKEDVSIVAAPPNSTIFRSGEPPDAVYALLHGSLEIGLEKMEAFDAKASLGSGERAKARRTKDIATSLPRINEGQGGTGANFKAMFRTSPGSFVGMLSGLTRDANIVTVRNPTNKDAILLKIPAKTFERVISQFPCALIKCLTSIIDTLGVDRSLCVSPAMYLLDWTLDWMHVESGEHIAIQGEECDSLFVVLNGRLRTGESESTSSQSDSSHEEFGRGATIGAIESLVEGRWSHDVYASRHCEVARIPIMLIHILMEMFPGAGLYFAKTIAAQVRRKDMGSKKSRSPPSLLPSYSLSLATIAVVPFTPNEDARDFCHSLTSELMCIAPTKLLTKQETKGLVGDALFKHRNTMLKVKMTRILGDLEENHRLVVYEADAKYSWWTKLCIQQADCILLLVNSNCVPDAINRVEEMITWAHKVKKVRVEMVVVQSTSATDDSVDSSNASDNLNNWSEERPFITKHHLVRSPFDDHRMDFQRMCRRVTGQAIGLALGGGGARGLAHLGVIKALNEVGVKIDMVGGTSQGAFIGAILAKYPDDEEKLFAAARVMADDMSSIKEKLLDLTLPIVSYFSGYRFNLGIKKVLGEDSRIQDFVLNYFCISSDLANSEMVIHEKGIAWKYVRASMSLAGYLPPIADGNRLLADGGYLNIVPGDIMADHMGARTVIAVDVSSSKNEDYYQYGTELSGAWLLWNSWNPFVQTGEKTFGNELIHQ